MERHQAGSAVVSQGHRRHSASLIDQLNRENLLFLTGCLGLMPCPTLERRNHAYFIDRNRLTPWTSRNSTSASWPICRRRTAKRCWNYAPEKSWPPCWATRTRNDPGPSAGIERGRRRGQPGQVVRMVWHCQAHGLLSSHKGPTTGHLLVCLSLQYIPPHFHSNILKPSFPNKHSHIKISSKFSRTILLLINKNSQSNHSPPTIILFQSRFFRIDDKIGISKSRASSRAVWDMTLRRPETNQ